VFENRVLRRIFGPKRDEVTGGWRKLHNEELHNLYSSPNISYRMIKSRKMRWAGHIARMGETINACKILVGKPEGKMITPRRRWEVNIKIDLMEMKFRVELDSSVQSMGRWRALVDTIMNPQVPLNKDIS
jgi:hypothetical protein